jgi:DNA-binding transcriptional ArsR family regulator
MSPEQLTVLRAAPSSRDVAVSLGRLAGRVDDIEPAFVGQHLEVLQGMGLVEQVGGGWSRTALGDREAGRESHGR